MSEIAILRLTNVYILFNSVKGSKSQHNIKI